MSRMALGKGSLTPRELLNSQGSHSQLNSLSKPRLGLRQTYTHSRYNMDSSIKLSQQSHSPLKLQSVASSKLASTKLRLDKNLSLSKSNLGKSPVLSKKANILASPKSRKISDNLRSNRMSGGGLVSGMGISKLLASQNRNQDQFDKKSNRSIPVYKEKT